MSTLVAQTISNGTVSTSSANVIQGSAKAWVNFAGANGSMRASYNLSSVTRNSTADYTLNFTNNMIDENYVVNIGCSGIGNDIRFNVYSTSNTGAPVLMTSSQVRIRGWTGADINGIYVSIFR
jgi:hypothetical protein